MWERRLRLKPRGGVVLSLWLLILVPAGSAVGRSFAATGDFDWNAWIPTFLQAGGLGLLLILLLKRVLITQQENEQRVKDIKDGFDKERAQLKATIQNDRENSAKWEKMAMEGIVNLRELKGQLDLALRAVQVVAAKDKDVH